MKKSFLTKFSVFFALSSAAVAAVFCTTGFKHNTNPINAKASDLPVAVVDKMVDDWNGRLDSGGKYYWYLVHTTANLDGSTGKSSSTNMASELGDGVKLNGKSFSSYNNGRLSICYENGGKYITFKVPTELITAEEGVGGTVVSVEEGTEFLAYQLPTFSFTINTFNKKAAMNSSPIGINKFTPNFYTSWFLIEMADYPVYGQFTTSLNTTRYGESGFSFLDGFYINGDESQRLFKAKSDITDGNMALTFNIGYTSGATNGHNIAFNNSILAVDPSTITSIGVHAGTALPLMTSASSFSRTETYVVDADYYADTNYGYAIKDTTVLGATRLIYDSHISFELEGFDTYDKLYSVDVSNDPFNFTSIYFDDDPTNTIMASGKVNSHAILYKLPQSSGFGLYGSQINTGINTASTITIPTGTQFPNKAVYEKTSGNFVYVVRKDVKLILNSTNVFVPEELDAKQDFGILTVSDVLPDSEGTYNFPNGGSNPLNLSSPIKGRSIAYKAYLNVPGSLQTEINFETISNWSKSCFRFKLNTSNGNAASVALQYGVPSGSWSDDNNLDKAYYSFTNGTDMLLEFYEIIVSDTQLRLVFCCNHKIVIDKTYSCVSTDFGSIIHMKAYVNGEGVQMKDYEKASEQAINRFGHYKLKLDDISTLETSDTGACKGTNGLYAAAKTYYNTYLTAAQKAELSSNTEAYARFSAWAAANGEVINVDGTLAPAAAIKVLGNYVNDYSLIILITVASLSSLAFLAFVILKKKRKLN